MGGTAALTEPHEAATSRARGRWLLAVASVLLVVVSAAALALRPYVVPTDSMAPTLEPGDRVVVDRLPGTPQRGDVVVMSGAALGDRDDVVKRVIGVAGDRITCCTVDGRLTRNGGPLDEPYLYPGDAPSATPFDVVVTAGHLWVLGDHRSDSGDSRSRLGSPGGGLVPTEDVVGRVVMRYWPPGRFGSLTSSTITSGSESGSASSSAPLAPTIERPVEPSS